MDLPFPIKGNVNVDRIDYSLTVDSNVFQQETHKIATIGRIKQKKFLVECNGKGHMNLKILRDPIEQIEALSKLRDRKIITDDEFEQKKKELLEKVE